MDRHVGNAALDHAVVARDRHLAQGQTDQRVSVPGLDVEVGWVVNGCRGILQRARIVGTVPLFGSLWPSAPGTQLILVPGRMATNRGIGPRWGERGTLTQSTCV